MRYQWGRKDPFTFANSSEMRSEDGRTGKYPVKIYTIDGVLIYQECNGSSNIGKQPAGGVIHSSTLAISMMEIIKNPNTFYGGAGIVLSQVGHTRGLYDYYWTSYSRGTDGIHGNIKKHNDYLDGYISQRVKSIYDPCPYGFQVPANGIYKQFERNAGWVKSSYTGGNKFNLNNISSWFNSSCRRSYVLSYFVNVGYSGNYYLSNASSVVATYMLEYLDDSRIYSSSNGYGRGEGLSVRCIENLENSCNEFEQDCMRFINVCQDANLMLLLPKYFFTKTINKNI